MDYLVLVPSRATATNKMQARNFERQFYVSCDDYSDGIHTSLNHTQAATLFSRFICNYTSMMW